MEEILLLSTCSSHSINHLLKLICSLNVRPRNRQRSSVKANCQDSGHFLTKGISIPVGTTQVIEEPSS